MDKSRVILVLLAVLGVLYAANIVVAQNLSNVLIDKPVKLSFVLIEPPEGVCENCYDPQDIVNIIDASHTISYKTTSIKYEDARSRKYIDMYGIKTLPTVVVSGDTENEILSNAWVSLDGRLVAGDVVIENLLPYYDIESGANKGMIAAILLIDETCSDCLDENQYISALQRFGMFVSETGVYDVASPEGSEIVRKYNVSRIPAAIFSPDAFDYPGFPTLWEEVGTVEEDGWLVFREVQKLGDGYKDI